MESGFAAALWSLVGMVGRFSSLGSTTKMLSGSGRLGPILPSGSNGNMIFTLMPSTPVKHHNVNQELKTYFHFIIALLSVNTLLLFQCSIGYSLDPWNT